MAVEKELFKVYHNQEASVMLGVNAWCLAVKSECIPSMVPN